MTNGAIVKLKSMGLVLTPALLIAGFAGNGYACEKIGNDGLLDLINKRSQNYAEQDNYDREVIISAIYSNDGKKIVGTRQTVILYRKKGWFERLFGGGFEKQMESVAFTICDISGSAVSTVKVEGSVEVGLDEYEPSLKALREAVEKGDKPSLATPGAGGPAPAAPVPLTSNAGPKASGGGGGGRPGAGARPTGVQFVDVIVPQKGGPKGCPSTPGKITICETRLAPQQER